MAERITGIPSSIEQRKEMFVGKTAPEVLVLLVTSLPEIKSVGLISYRRGFKWGELYPSFGKQLELGVARDERVSRSRILSANFWENHMEDLKKIDIPEDSPLTAEEVARWYLEDGLEEDVYVAFSSKVEVEIGRSKDIQDIRYIPLMDFRCKPSQENQNHVKNLLRERGEQQGVILDSGKSYHYYGLRTLPLYEWNEWMRRWYWTLADNFYIANAQVDGNNWLRLTSGITKPEVPVVVDVI